MTLTERYALAGLVGETPTSIFHAARSTENGRRVIVEKARWADRIAVHALERAAVALRESLPSCGPVEWVANEAGSWLAFRDPGSPLADALGEGPMPPRAVADAGAVLAASLAALERVGTVHGAIDTRTVFLRGSAASLLGLCAVRPVGPSAWDPSTSSSTDPAYTAPERFEPSAEDIRSDVYSLACVLFAMLTGAPPFSASDPLQLRLQHLKAPVPRSLSHGGAEWDQLLGSMLAKDPAMRPSPRQVRDALQLIARADSPAVGRSRRRRDKARVLTIGAAGLVGLALLVGVALRPVLEAEVVAPSGASATPRVAAQTSTARVTATVAPRTTPPVSATASGPTAAPTPAPNVPPTPPPTAPPSAAPAAAAAPQPTPAPSPTPVRTPPPAPTSRVVPTRGITGETFEFMFIGLAPGVSYTLSYGDETGFESGDIARGKVPDDGIVRYLLRTDGFRSGFYAFRVAYSGALKVLTFQIL